MVKREVRYELWAILADFLWSGPNWAAPLLSGWCLQPEYAFREGRHSPVNVCPLKPIAGLGKLVFWMTGGPRKLWVPLIRSFFLFPFYLVRESSDE